MEMFNGMFGKIASGMCRLSMTGGIAVKTSNGYKTYNLKTNKLTNCNNFVFNIGEEFFFVIPTNSVKPGDIIIASGKPKCVVSVAKDTIKVINYEDSVVQDILPERHVFMGNTYFYGKIVSMFGDNIGKGKTGMNKLMSYMMLIQNHDFLESLIKPRWIPVTEAPTLKVGDEGYPGYLVYANGYYDVADYTVDRLGNGPSFHVDGEYEPDITHYMPLPKPPKEETR